jgi:uncharacterized protein (DUF924 family)
MATQKLSIQEILDFWFSDRIKPHWFNSTEAIDSELKDRFEACYIKARDGELIAWEKSSEGLLALIILLDQLPLNIYRGTIESFATEAKAIALSKQLIKHKGLDTFNREQQLFSLLPLVHSELLADHSLALSTAMGLGWKEEDCQWFKHHQSIVEKYGRFPHRNAILGRQSTADEEAYLSSSEAFTG